MGLGGLHDASVHDLPAHRAADRVGLQLVESLRAAARSRPAPRSADQPAAAARRRGATNRARWATAPGSATPARAGHGTEDPNRARGPLFAGIDRDCGAVGP